MILLDYMNAMGCSTMFCVYK